MFIAAFALSLVLIQDPATGQAGQSPAVVTEEERERAEREEFLNEVICRREHVVGSNRPQRICQTRRQWEHIRDLSQDAARNADRHRDVDGLGSGEGGR